MTDLHKITIAEARSRLRKKEITSVELTEACISAVEGSDALNAYCVKTPELAREQAKKADELLLKGNAPDMCGIPLGIKDLFCTKNVNSQAASKILTDFKPQYESTVLVWSMRSLACGTLGAWRAGPRAGSLLGRTRIRTRIWRS